MNKIVPTPNISWFNYVRYFLLALGLLSVSSGFAQAPNISYTPNTVTYTVNKLITPLIPGNTGGTITGGTESVSVADGDFTFPNSVAPDPANNVLYFTDQSVIRKVNLATKATSVFAGVFGASGINDGPGNQATFGTLNGIARDGLGNLYVCDIYYNNIRKITAGAYVSLLAGSPYGYGSASYDDGFGDAARFSGPRGITIGKDGNLYVADQYNNCIRMITPAGMVTTAFTGLYFPAGIATDVDGNFYVTDRNSDNTGAVKKITPSGVISTITTGIGEPHGVTIDAQGNIYAINQLLDKVIKIAPNGTIIKLNAGVFLDGVAADGVGNIYVASGDDVKKLGVPAYTIDKDLPAGLIFDSETGTIKGTPTAISPATVYTITANNAAGSASTTLTIQVNAVVPVLSPPHITYATPQTYNVDNPISPLVPTNTGGAVPLSGAGILSPVVSTGFNTTTSVAVDLANNAIYVCDWGNNQIKKVNLTTKAVSVFAGSGASGATNGTGTQTSFNLPDAIIRDKAGNFYVSDMSNNMIRKITPAGVVTTLAGNGNSGSTDGTGPAASFNTPRGLGIDAAGNLYVADQGNNLIRKITPAGAVTTIASGFNWPTSVDVDAAGNLFVSDLNSGSIKKISVTGGITTVASNIGQPREIRIDAAGNLYVSDQNGSVKRISQSGVVTVLATGLNGPIGLALDGMGSMYIAASGSSSVVKITVGGYSIDKPLPPGLIFDPTTGIISGTPTAAWPLTVYTVTARNTAGVSSTTLSIKVNGPKLPSVITFPGFDYAHFEGDIVNPGAYSTNTETPIIYASSNPAVATVTDDGKLKVHGPGNSQITATQAGNANYSPAQPVTVTLTVIVDQKLDFPVIAAKSVCSTDFPLNVANDDFGLDFPLSDIPIIYTSSNPAVATVSPAGTVHVLSAGTTTITATQDGDINYSAAEPASQLLTVTSPPVPAVSIAADQTSICQGAVAKFTANVSNLPALTNPKYQWQLNGNNVGSNSNSYTFAVSATDVVKCTVTNNAACAVYGSANGPLVTVNAVSNLSVSISPSVDGAICAGTSLTFNAVHNNSSGSLTYQWHLNNVDVGGNQGSYTNDAFVNGDQVSCTITNTSNPCLIPATSLLATVNVNPIANADASVSITASSYNVYAGTAVTFTAIAANMSGTVSYQWQINGKNAGANSANFTTSTLNNGDAVTCIVTSSSPCSAPVVSASVIETVLPPLIIVPPNAFTPNGDGINDQWLIAGLNTYPNCKVTVYSRYGAQVYFSKSYTKPWDGTINGAELPVGTYYYVIELNQTRPKVTGYVAIIR